MVPHLPERSVEPWLRGTRPGMPAVPTAALHALDLTREDFARWIWPLPPELWEEMPCGLPSPAFQARHIARSLDRLLTYAEGGGLTEAQHAALAAEHEAKAPAETESEFANSLVRAEQHILALATVSLEKPCFVGRARLPVTLGALLVHIADHTQRHAGQAVTTAKVLRNLQLAQQS